MKLFSFNINDIFQKYIKIILLLNNYFILKYYYNKNIFYNE